MYWCIVTWWRKRPDETRKFMEPVKVKREMWSEALLTLTWRVLATTPRLDTLLVLIWSRNEPVRVKPGTAVKFGVVSEPSLIGRFSAMPPLVPVLIAPPPLMAVFT